MEEVHFREWEGYGEEKSDEKMVRGKEKQTNRLTETDRGGKGGGEVRWKDGESEPEKEEEEEEKKFV